MISTYLAMLKEARRQTNHLNQRRRAVFLPPLTKLPRSLITLVDLGLTDVEILWHLVVCARRVWHTYIWRLHERVQIRLCAHGGTGRARDLAAFEADCLTDDAA